MELGWLAGETSAARDLDVLVEELLPRVGRLGEADSEGGANVLDALTADRAAARARVLAALDSPRYFALVDRLVAEAGSPRLAGQGLRMRSARPERVRADGARRPAGRRAEPDDAAMHRLRIAGKRARYAGELATLPDDREGQAFIRAAKTSRTCSEPIRTPSSPRNACGRSPRAPTPPSRSRPGASSSRRRSAAPRLGTTFPMR